LEQPIHGSVRGWSSKAAATLQTHRRGISFCDPPEMVSPSQHPITGARALAFDAD